MEIEAKIAQMGLTIPSLPDRSIRRARAVRTGNLLFLEGHGPFKDGGYPFKGPVGERISITEAAAATRYNALAMLSTVKSEIGDLDRVVKIVNVLALGYGSAGFNRAGAVADGCSELLLDLYGSRGGHARSAIAVMGLGLDIVCQTEMIVEVEAE
jgi:hypothetical protein